MKRNFVMAVSVVATFCAVVLAFSTGAEAWRWKLEGTECKWSDDNGINQCQPGAPAPTGQTWFNLNFVVRDAASGEGMCGVNVALDQDFGNGSSRVTNCDGFANFGVTDSDIGFALNVAGFQPYPGSVSIHQDTTLYLTLMPVDPNADDSGDGAPGNPDDEDSNNGSGGEAPPATIYFDMDNDAVTYGFQSAQATPGQMIPMPANGKIKLTLVATQFNSTVPIPGVGLRLALITSPIGHDHDPFPGGPGKASLWLASIAAPVCNTGYNGYGCVVTLSSHGIAAAIGFRATLIQAPNTEFAIPTYVNAGVFGLYRMELYADPSFSLVGVTDFHLDNHYCVAWFCAKLRLFSQMYKTRWNQPLVYNDASLKLGGLFDFKGNWAPPHQTHRFGLNMDVRGNSLENAVPQSGPQFAYFFALSLALFGQAPSIDDKGLPTQHLHLSCRNCGS